MNDRQPVLVAYGGGVNSTALLCGLVERGDRPDAILFADTGGEKPETYEYILGVAHWLLAKGFPALVVVRDELGGDLEDRCLQEEMLPSLAYGTHKRGCSEKSKQRPQHRWARAWERTTAWWARDDKPLVRKLIGYGADERYRAKILEDRWYEYVYPLIEWGWDREVCEKAIARAGLPPAPKSACFFCPASKKHEVIQLGIRHPDLLARALEIERGARPNLESRKGLGGYFSWEKLWRDFKEDRPLYAEAEEEVEANPFGCLCVTPTPDDEPPPDGYEPSILPEVDPDHPLRLRN
jgi:hypothetical protein